MKQCHEDKMSPPKRAFTSCIRCESHLGAALVVDKGKALFHPCDIGGCIDQRNAPGGSRQQPPHRHLILCQDSWQSLQHGCIPCRQQIQSDPTESLRGMPP